MLSLRISPTYWEQHFVSFHTYDRAAVHSSNTGAPSKKAIPYTSIGYTLYSRTVTRIVKISCIPPRTLEAVSHCPQQQREHRLPVSLPPPAPFRVDPPLPSFLSGVPIPPLPTSLVCSGLRSHLSALHGLSPCFVRKKCLPALVEERGSSIKHPTDPPSPQMITSHPCSPLPRS